VSNVFGRRQLIQTTAASAVFSIVPSYVLGRSGDATPSGKVNIAGVGVGGMGSANLHALCKALSYGKEGDGSLCTR